MQSLSSLYISKAVAQTTRQMQTEISYADAAIAKMRGPSQMQIICIDITNKCDLACSNCTRLLANQDVLWDMTPDNFRTAVRSLVGFDGTIAVIGGNPCMHPQFEQICKIFKEEFPLKRQRGLWTNNVFRHHDLVVDTFGGFNLNPHGEDRGVRSLSRLYEAVKTGNYYEGHSHHAPLLTAVRDLYGEKEMWEHISNCDINREWSATIIQNNGQLRAYFCEVAASFDLARKTDHGMPVVDGWWKMPLLEFSGQVKHFCPGCGVPAKLVGSLDKDETDTYTRSNLDLVTKSQQKGRKTIELDTSKRLRRLDHNVTEYPESHSRHKRLRNRALRFLKRHFERTFRV